MTEVDRLKQLGNAAFKEARFQQAVEHFTAAVALDRTSHLLFSNRSGALAAVGRYQEALEDAEQCLALNPTWAKGHSRKGAALYGLGRYEDAVSTYEAGLALDPSSMQMTFALEDLKKACPGAEAALASGAPGRA